ncbi:UNVERIFIED_CONTAM: N-methyl-L-tryptophan oxidase [Brevibacillus sp. OAP136]
MKHYDVIVLGAGSMGMAAGYYLAKRGIKTLLIDSYDPPHANGSHHGDTRLIRFAMQEDPAHVPFAIRAVELWKETERQTKRKLFAKTGVLNVAVPSSAHYRNILDCVNRFQLPVEELSSQEIRYRWPGIKIGEEFIGCHEPSAGVLFSEECIRSHRELAIAMGAVIKTNSPVEDIILHQTGVIVKCRDTSHSADHLVVSAGSWAKKIGSILGLALPLEVMRYTVAWYESVEELFSAEIFPAFFFDIGQSQYYGFPSFQKSGVKIGRYDQWDPVDPDKIDRNFASYPDEEENMRTFLQKFMPESARQFAFGKVCMCTHTPDDNFIIDKHPEYPHVVMAAGFSGAGFKYASVVGDICSRLVTGEPQPLDIASFSVKRFR